MRFGILFFFNGICFAVVSQVFISLFCNCKFSVHSRKKTNPTLKVTAWNSTIEIQKNVHACWIILGNNWIRKRKFQIIRCNGPKREYCEWVWLWLILVIVWENDTKFIQNCVVGMVIPHIQRNPQKNCLNYRFHAKISHFFLLSTNHHIQIATKTCLIRCFCMTYRLKLVYCTSVQMHCKRVNNLCC